MANTSYSRLPNEYFHYPYNLLLPPSIQIKKKKNEKKNNDFPHGKLRTNLEQKKKVAP